MASGSSREGLSLVCQDIVAVVAATAASSVVVVGGWQ